MKSACTLLLCALLAAGCGGSGEAGATGSTGATGATGSTGPTGALDQIVHGVRCVALDAGSGTSLQFKYDSETMTSGDRHVSCAVSTAGQESSYGTEYEAVQTGASTGSCPVNMGVGATDFGFWTFTYQSSVGQVVYSDVGSAHNGYSYTFTSGQCSSF